MFFGVNMEIEEIKCLIPNSEDFCECKKLDLGWSEEEKYIVGLTDGKKILLRFVQNESFESQIGAIETLKAFSKISDLVPRVLDYGSIDGSNFSFIKLEYINGSNAMGLISSYTIKEQYDFGYVMGKTIKEFHKQSKPEFLPDEKEKFFKKVQGFLDYYHEHKSEFSFLPDKEEIIYEFLKKIENRPFVLLHNDFHLGNMIIDGDKINLIDFNRASFGDSIKEFDGIAWSVKTSKYFAQGILDAYLEDEIEKEFFELLKGYITIWQIQMLSFIKNQDEEEKNIVINLIKFVESWFEDGNATPNWYVI